MKLSIAVGWLVSGLLIWWFWYNPLVTGILIGAEIVDTAWKLSWWAEWKRRAV